MKRADDVLDSVQIDRSFPADRGIHRGQNGRRDGLKVDTAHIGCGGKPGKIADHAAADGNHAVLAGESMREQFREQVLQRCERLLALFPGMVWAAVIRRANRQ